MATEVEESALVTALAADAGVSDDGSDASISVLHPVASDGGNAEGPDTAPAMDQPVAGHRGGRLLAPPLPLPHPTGEPHPLFVVRAPTPSAGVGDAVGLPPPAVPAPGTPGTPTIVVGPDSPFGKPAVSPPHTPMTPE